MTDAVIEAMLRDAFAHGLVEREGEVVGLWHATSIDLGTRGGDTRSGAWAKAVWRTPKGRWCAQDMPIGEVARVTSGEGEPRSNLGAALLVLDAIAREGDRDRRTGTDLAARMVTAVRGRFPGMGWIQAKGIADGVLADLRPGISRLFDALDPTALRTLMRHPAHMWVLGDNWALIDGTDPARPLAAALDRHPGLPGTIGKVLNRLGPVRFASEAVDPRRLDDLLVRSLREDVPERLIPAVGHAERALARMAEERRGREEEGPGWKLVRLFNPRMGDPDWPVRLALDLARLPASWTPRDDAQWVAHATAHPLVDAVVERRRSPGPEVVDGLDAILNVGGDWVAWTARLHAIAGTTDGGDLTTALANAQDVATAYERQVLAPLRCATIRARGGTVRPRDPEDDDDSLNVVATRVLFGGRTVARVLELSADWHRRQTTMAAAIAAMPGAIDDHREWPAGLPDAEMDGITFKVLRHDRALVDEGAAGRDRDGVDGLANCVGGYGDPCRSGRSRIVSLRRGLPDGTWERLSVAELQVDDGSFDVRQHVGHGNGRPPDACGAALHDYVRRLRAGDLPWESVWPVRGTVGHLNDVERVGGFDPYVEATRLAVQGLWDRYVPRPLRGMDYDTLDALCSWEQRQPWPTDLGLPGVAARAESLGRVRRERVEADPRGVDPGDDFAFPF